MSINDPNAKILNDLLSLPEAVPLVYVPGEPTTASAEFGATSWVDVGDYLREAGARVARSRDRLRAHRKRHAQWVAVLEARIVNAEAKARCATEKIKEAVVIIRRFLTLLDANKAIFAGPDTVLPAREFVARVTKETTT